jgi:crotonobetainyl-CoA:carnitine CoA-transferase CaiB-like acyl-CoA transferase
LNAQLNPALGSLRVIEMGDEQAEYCGLVLASLGADVIKVEPPGGSPTRHVPPFYEDHPDPNRSLMFWNYNRGKRSVVLDLATRDGRSDLRSLIARADVLLQSGRPGEFDSMGLSPGLLRDEFPSLIVARMTPFGDDGPWADFAGSDLVHLALGGVLANCGYDPDPSGEYDLPPIAPQIWHAYHIAGDQLAGGIVAALITRNRTGSGQYVSCAVHEAVAKNTELDVPSWIMRRLPFKRQTCKHASEVVYRIPSILPTKDGRWIIAFWNDDVALRRFLESYDLAGDLEALENNSSDEAAKQVLGRPIPGIPIDPAFVERQVHRMGIIARFVGSFTYAEFPWEAAQVAGLMFAPLRKPHENALDEHWLARGTVSDVAHPDLGRSFRYVTSRWISSATRFVAGGRPPLLDEDREIVKTSSWQEPRKNAVVGNGLPSSTLGRFALDGIRVLDFSWFLASAGGTRFLTALGAETIKVEWRDRPDTRFGAQAPVGGRAARALATGPLEGVDDPEMGGQFHSKNAGKRGISLNVADPRGLELARRLVELSDVVAEGFSPGVMDRLGLGYSDLRAIKPDIIYAQQSGMGQQGTYPRLRVVGPVAQSITGANEMSGLPEPAMPAGWGYSYLDWAGAYSFATAILCALYHRDLTGEGQWIDASQCEVGVFLNGVPILDWSANNRVWTRSGNRSPYGTAAPHGVYRCRGRDRWVAIVCKNDAQWGSLAVLMGRPELAEDARFVNLSSRLEHQDELDTIVNTWTQDRDAYSVMELLQRAGVPAGVSQTAEDRCEHDPQLSHLEWLTEVTGTKIGRWPVAGLPIRMSDTPPHIGGVMDRGAPTYGEDNEYVFGELLGLASSQIRRLAEDSVI